MPIPCLPGSLKLQDSSCASWWGTLPATAHHEAKQEATFSLAALNKTNAISGLTAVKPIWSYLLLNAFLLCRCFPNTCKRVSYLCIIMHATMSDESADNVSRAWLQIVLYGQLHFSGKQEAALSSGQEKSSHNQQPYLPLVCKK